MSKSTERGPFRLRTSQRLKKGSIIAVTQDGEAMHVFSKVDRDEYRVFYRKETSAGNVVTFRLSGGPRKTMSKQQIVSTLKKFDGKMFMNKTNTSGGHIKTSRLSENTAFKEVETLKQRHSRKGKEKRGGRKDPPEKILDDETPGPSEAKKVKGGDDEEEVEEIDVDDDEDGPKETVKREIEEIDVDDDEDVPNVAVKRKGVPDEQTDDEAEDRSDAKKTKDEEEEKQPEPPGTPESPSPSARGLRGLEKAQEELEKVEAETEKVQGELKQAKEQESNMPEEDQALEENQRTNAALLKATGGRSSKDPPLLTPLTLLGRLNKADPEISPPGEPLPGIPEQAEEGGEHRQQQEERQPRVIATDGVDDESPGEGTKRQADEPQLQGGSRPPKLANVTQSYPNMSEGNRVAAQRDAAIGVLELETKNAQTKAALTEVATNQDGAVNRLSNNEAGTGSTTYNAQTGHSASMATAAHNVDAGTVMNTSLHPTSFAPQQQTFANGELRNPVQNADPHNADINQTGRALLGSRLPQHSDQIELGPQSATASANEMVVLGNISQVDLTPVGPPGSNTNRIAELQNENTELTRKHEELLARIDELTGQQQIQDVAVGALGDTDRLGRFDAALEQQKREDEAANPTDAELLAMVRTVNAPVNIFTGQPDVDTAEEEVGDTTTPEVGSTSRIADVPARFSPTTSRASIVRLQKIRGATMTIMEQEQTLEALRPLYNEYTTARLTQGIREAEIMPSILVRSDHSTFRAASNVRGDITNAAVASANFLFWLLRRHGGSERHSPITWQRFFSYSYALGFREFTTAQINWLVTDNIHGNLSSLADFATPVNVAGDDGQQTPFDADERVPLFPGGDIPLGEIHALNIQLRASPSPTSQFPASSVTPDALPTDSSTHPDGSTGPDRQTEAAAQGQAEFSNIPNVVHNIPDPRFSTRGGERVPNIRYVTVPNKKYNPKKPQSAGNQRFITKSVSDTAAGSKDAEKDIAIANSDRLLKNKVQRLYPPIHALPCDRFLGSRNYQRLGVGLDKYMKLYSKHGWNSRQKKNMYDWNVFVMQLYGPTFYAFVGNKEMTRTLPVFDMKFPKMVGEEYMELNELLKEVIRYQRSSTDRADRVEGAGMGERPLEKQLTDFFTEKDKEDKAKLLQANAVVLSIPGAVPSGGGGGGPDDRPGVLPPVNDEEPTDDEDNPNFTNKVTPTEFAVDQALAGTDTPSTPARFQQQNKSGLVIKDTSQFRIGPKEMDNGIRRNRYHPGLDPSIQPTARNNNVPPTIASKTDNRDMNRRVSLFQRFNRR